MEYTQDIEIALPRARVIELFLDPAHLPKWQKGFISIEPLEGEPGAQGSTAKLTFQRGRSGTMELHEKITTRNLPEEFHAVYEAKGVENLSESHFVELDSHRTKWVTRNVFEFSGFMKVIGFVFAKSFPKQSMEYLVAFKNFAEAEGRGSTPAA